MNWILNKLGYSREYHSDCEAWFYDRITTIAQLAVDIRSPMLTKHERDKLLIELVDKSKALQKAYKKLD